ncbi:hypothetical protein D3C86_1994590 [compost metagenome]
MREDLRRQRLHQLAGRELVEPAIEQLHDIGTVAGHVGGNDAGLVVGIGEGRVLDRDVGIGLLEILDQLVHRLDAGLEHILPIFDFHRLCGVERHEAHSRHKACK